MNKKKCVYLLKQEIYCQRQIRQDRQKDGDFCDSSMSLGRNT